MWAPNWKIRGKDYSQWEESFQSKQKREIDEIVESIISPKEEEQEQKEEQKEEEVRLPTLEDFQRVYSGYASQAELLKLRKDIQTIVLNQAVELRKKEIKERLKLEAKLQRRKIRKKIEDREARRILELLERDEIEELTMLLITEGII
jgi:hypothetical protein